MIELYNKQKEEAYQGNGIYSNYQHKEKVRIQDGEKDFYIPVEYLNKFINKDMLFSYKNDLKAIKRLLLRLSVFVCLVGSFVFSFMSLVTSMLFIPVSPGFVISFSIIIISFLFLLSFILKGIKEGSIKITFENGI